MVTEGSQHKNWLGIWLALRLAPTRWQNQQRGVEPNAVALRRGSAGTVHWVRAELVELFRGRWVALDDTGNVVADSDELGELLERLEAVGLRANTVQRVPSADDPLFVGLS